MLDHYGDVLAIPFFAWLSFYFHQIPNRTPEETILFLFSFGGLIADLLFTMDFMQRYRTINPYIAVFLYLTLVYVLHLVLFHRTFKLAPI